MESYFKIVILLLFMSIKGNNLILLYYIYDIIKIEGNVLYIYIRIKKNMSGLCLHKGKVCSFQLTNTELL